MGAAAKTFRMALGHLLMKVISWLISDNQNLSLFLPDYLLNSSVVFSRLFQQTLISVVFHILMSQFIQDQR